MALTRGESSLLWNLLTKYLKGKGDTNPNVPGAIRSNRYREKIRQRRKARLQRSRRRAPVLESGPRPDACRIASDQEALTIVRDLAHKLALGLNRNSYRMAELAI